ncbi:hypothetical protein [Oxynema aestuarii]|uniref:Uncharacterized protein n=1 Tax=Oxynema aestuarii AP17 TaxID=2064643 RepID=A0A6H1U285_9CYAN|nr:hypothetical protein [Oxynema aestuarii]QIZ72765.1 hypothetical protein HCG48_20995 [Oxynema aestuarii AP17]
MREIPALPALERTRHRDRLERERRAIAPGTRKGHPANLANLRFCKRSALKDSNGDRPPANPF